MKCKRRALIGNVKMSRALYSRRDIKPRHPGYEMCGGVKAENSPMLYGN